MKVLKLFFGNPNESHYLREVVRVTGEEVNAIKRELDILTDEHLLLRERRLNKVFFTLNKNYLFYDEFMRIFAKLDPLAQQIIKNHPKLGKIKYVALSLKYTKQVVIKEDEVYLLFVGTVVVPEVSFILGEIEKTAGRQINYTVMAEDEFMFRKRNTDPFLWRFLRAPKVMLIGNEDDLLR